MEKVAEGFAVQFASVLLILYIAEAVGRVLQCTELKPSRNRTGFAEVS